MLLLSKKCSDWADKNYPQDTSETDVKIPKKNDLDLDFNNDQNESNEKNMKHKIINKLYYKISKYIHPDKTDDKIKNAFFTLCKKSQEHKMKENNKE